MIQARPEGYIGKQFQEGFTGYLSAGDFYGVVSLEEGITQDLGKQLLEQFKQGLLEATISDLATFESTISNLILKFNFPVHVALAIGMTYKDALYIKTIGEGQVYFRRGNTFDLLISGDKCASGYLQQFDMAVFTTTQIKEVIGGADDIKAFVDLSPPKDIIEKMHGEAYDEEERGFVVLFVEYGASPVVEPVVEPEVPSGSVQPPTVLNQSSPVSPVVPSPVIPPTDAGRGDVSLIQKVQTIIRSKAFVIVAVIVLFAVLAWSVVFGYQRRQAAALATRVETVREEIQTKLTQAEEEAFLNMDESLALLAEAKAQLATLKEEVGGAHATEIAEIEEHIQNAESQITKKEEKQAEEFYDLALESKEAKGVSIFKEGEMVAILDPGEEIVYVLDLSKKSLAQYSSSDLSEATLVALYNETVFFFNPEEGIFKFTTQSNTSNIIEADADWGTIKDMSIYNGNIYILDTGSDEVYKYLVTEGGYSDKTSYFASGQSFDLGEATALTIDSAIYLSTKDQVYKYLSGVAESFSTSYPHDDPAFDDVYTDEELEQVFVLDKAKGTVYVLTKDGEYQRQVQSSIFAKANGLYVYDNEVHVLVDSKLYSVPLD